jgi:hypothetical protein
METITSGGQSDAEIFRLQDAMYSQDLENPSAGEDIMHDEAAAKKIGHEDQYCQKGVWKLLLTICACFTVLLIFRIT